jgi:uncharacterized membrane protein
VIQDFFKSGTLHLATGVEGAAALVIGLATLQAIIRALSAFLGRASWCGGEVRDQTRLDLGRWLALVLEFELAADILRTAVAPTWNEIGQLAAIVVLRTLLNFFLQKEIDSSARRAERRQPEPSGWTDGGPQTTATGPPENAETKL